MRCRHPAELALRALVIVVLTATVAAGRVAASPAGAFETADSVTAQQEVAGELATLHSAYNLLLDHFYRQVDPVALLTAAWNGANGALSASGFAGPLAAPPDLPPEREDAWSVFADRLPSVLQAGSDGGLRQEMIWASAAAMAASLRQSRTAFLDPRAFATLVAGRDRVVPVSGLGLVLSQRAPWIVLQLADDGPAARAGVQTGDTLRAIDGRDVTVLARDAVTSLLRGPDGEFVTLVLERRNGDTLDLDVVRGPFRFPSFEARSLAANVGYLRLRSLPSSVTPPERPTSDSVLDQLDTALASFQRDGVTGWVLDLRGNDGGDEATAREVAGRFLPDLPLFQTSDERGRRGVRTAAGPLFSVQQPLVVLVDGETAGSAEILASALQEYGRAALLGTRTAGAAAGALLFPLKDGSALQVAVAEVRTGRRGAAINEVGVTPNIIVPDARGPGHFAAGTDPQLDSAIAAVGSAPRSTLPPSLWPSPVAPSVAALRDRLSAVLPSGADLARALPGLSVSVIGEQASIYASQYVARGGSLPDATGLAGLTAARRWQGGYSRYYGSPAGISTSTYSITVDLYETEQGAAQAAGAVDWPLTRKEVDDPRVVGDAVKAYEGMWEEAQSAFLIVRAGRAVATILSTGSTTAQRLPGLAPLARLMEERLHATGSLAPASPSAVSSSPSTPAPLPPAPPPTDPAPAEPPGNSASTGTLRGDGVDVVHWL